MKKALFILSSYDRNGVTTFNETLSAEMQRQGYDTYFILLSEIPKRQECDVVVINNRSGLNYAEQNIKANRYLFFVHSLMNERSLPPSVSSIKSLEVFVFSEVARDFIKTSFPQYQLTLIRNMIDMGYFYPTLEPFDRSLMQVLDLRNGGLYVQKFRNVAKSFGIWVNNLTEPVNDIKPLLQQSVICVGYGRHAIESMAMGIPTIIYGVNGGDGLVTSKNMRELAETNFSGWSFRTMPPPGELTELHILQEIGRMETLNLGKVTDYIRKEYCIKKNILKLEL